MKLVCACENVIYEGEPITLAFDTQAPDAHVQISCKTCKVPAFRIGTPAGLRALEFGTPTPLDAREAARSWLFWRIALERCFYGSFKPAIILVFLMALARDVQVVGVFSAIVLSWTAGALAFGLARLIWVGRKKA